MKLPAITLKKSNLEKNSRIIKLCPDACTTGAFGHFLFFFTCHKQPFFSISEKNSLFSLKVLTAFKIHDKLFLV